MKFFYTAATKKNKGSFIMALKQKLVSSIALSAATAAMLTLSGCGSSSSSSTPPPADTEWPYVAPVACADADYTVPTSADLPAEITSCTKLTAGSTWYLPGKVVVKNGTTLKIDAGAVVAGKTPASFLAIAAGSKLLAVGTQADPITFTSKLDDDGQSQDNAAGEWGGLVLAGHAYTHYSKNTYEADEKITYGRTDHKYDAESSGDLEYVVIKHSGYEVEKDKELNGLSLAGVGSGTVIKHVAVIGGLDDGMEIWGGTVNIDGLYIYNANDDSVDTDLGYRGTIQNVLVRQVNVDKTNNHDSAGMEFGNDQNTISTDDTNATQPTIINYTGYIKGGGFYNKFDAGFKWNNVKFISNKTVDLEQVHFRGTDSYDTGAKHALGAVSFIDNNVTLTAANTYSASNSKDPKTEKTAKDYFITDNMLDGIANVKYDDASVPGATEADIWKGHAGDNNALETDPYPVQ